MSNGIKYQSKAQRSVHGLVAKRNGIDVGLLFPVVDEMSDMAVDLDKKICELLDEKIGDGWNPDLLTTEPSDGSRRVLKYAGVNIGYTRSVIVVQRGQAIGNMYVEIEDSEEVEKLRELNRKQYQMVKHMDHHQMNTFLCNIHKQGKEEGRKEAGLQFPDETELAEKLLTIKGIGSGKAAMIAATVIEYMKEKADEKGKADFEVSGE